jgi:microcystin-dependent protein
MASTYSPSLRIELIGDGDQSGIWGQTTNNNLGSLIEQAISGVVTITMVNATYTLSNFNGVTDEARNQVLVVTGTNTAVRNVVAPLVEKTYIVKNSTTGGFGIQIIGSSGLGVTIPNGVTASVYCDGTNFYSAEVNTVGNQTINGNLTVTGTTTLTGATTMSSALTYGGVALSNSVTGTGSMVLSASPTLTGAPLAPTATAGTNTTQLATTAFVQAATTALGLGTMATQNANNVAITGGTINGTTLGATTAASVRGTTGTFTGALSAASASFTAALPVLSGGTGVTTSTGTGNVVLSTSPTLVTPILGTPTSGTLTNCTFPTLNQNTTGTAGGLTGTPNITVGTVSGTTITASTQFSGPGTGLSGTATSLTAGAATNATNATNVVSGGTIASNVTATTQAAGTNNTTVATTAFVLTNGAPTGGIMMWGTGTAPTGWLLCAGAAVSRSTYSALFAIIGTTFGVGDGSTTFNLPNYTNRMPYGTTVGTTGGSATTTLITANLPSHTHSITDPGHAHVEQYNGGTAGSGGGMSNSGVSLGDTASSASTATATTGITATDATGSGTAATTISPYLGINFIIKT